MEAWQALSRGLVFAAPGDPLADRLREAEIAVTSLAEADPERLAGETAVPGAGIRASLRLLAHVHEASLPGAGALAERLAGAAAEHGEATFLLPVDNAEALTKAVFEHALKGDLEVEVVVGRAPAGHRLLDLVRVMTRLRGPGGCPWDAEQTHETLARYLLDESYELLEAIEGTNRDHLAEELGDLLLQVVFHAQVAWDAGHFDIDDVADRIATKLVTRHPHVFGNVEVSGAGEVVANWEVIKDHEKGRRSVVEGVPEALPALAYAQKLGGRTEKLALPDGGPEEEPPADEEAFGELLWAVVAAARRAGVDAESALRRRARAFRDRLLRLEATAADRGVAVSDLSPGERAKLWEGSA